MNRYTKSLLGTWLPPVAVFLLFYFVIRIDIYSSALLAVVLLILLLIRRRTMARGSFQKPVRTASAQMEKELAELMAGARDDMNGMLQVAKTVKSREVSAQAMTLYQLGEKIMDYLQRNPEKISKARRFFNYYLKTARDILEKYYEFERTDIPAAEVAELEKRTGSALVTLQESFRKQYVRLVKNEMLDIEADIDLLEKTSKHEG